MAENKTTQPTQTLDVGHEKRLDIKKIYIKDLSFEAPRAPDIDGGKWSPHLDIQLHNSSLKLDQQDLYEVTLQINITATENEKSIFTIEVSQAGVFEVVGTNQNETAATLQVHCPHILFPFARETIASLVTKGGFPQLLIGPINFDAIFNQNMQALQSEQRQSGKPH